MASLRTLRPPGGQMTLGVHGVIRDLIPFDGWVIITAILHGNEDPSLSIYAPFPVSTASGYATIGFNSNVHPR